VEDTAAGRVTGTLYLVPVPLGPEEDPLRVLPPATVDATAALDCFIAEHARSARAVLARLPMRRPLQEIQIAELNRNTPEDCLPGLLEPLLAGRDAGLLSEAGCPAVADPGAALVALAHRRGIRVVPLVGPSSLLLALMASGMNGQAFSFAGYVPVDPAERAERLRELERRSASTGETVLMIETPYRTQALFDAMLAALAPATRIGVAARLTMAGETTQSRTVAEWRELRPELERTPTVLSLQGERSVAPPRPRANAPRGKGARDKGPRPSAGARPPRAGRGR
jgi:16S rRNA (cytidine1402-2'-O)-methyltransferase